jgi:hypothetical protein
MIALVEVASRLDELLGLQRQLRLKRLHETWTCLFQISVTIQPFSRLLSFWAEMTLCSQAPPRQSILNRHYL